ncbi:hypothetical protein KIN20_033744 [Parelaphostrongylus tenuis]|uniref:Uncharacterized protein n=1 Tax=Parelaphostrongylus tenuis TaxID=148309 RepID=A0AAD5RAX4_PARTN|nr:hypothetical protein KIN20_033744 [Parelaphostrongylus tenuis]
MEGVLPVAEEMKWLSANSQDSSGAKEKENVAAIHFLWKFGYPGLGRLLNEHIKVHDSLE